MYNTYKINVISNFIIHFNPLLISMYNIPPLVLSERIPHSFFIIIYCIINNKHRIWKPISNYLYLNKKVFTIFLSYYFKHNIILCRIKKIKIHAHIHKKILRRYYWMSVTLTFMDTNNCMLISNQEIFIKVYLDMSIRWIKV